MDRLLAACANLDIPPLPAEYNYSCLPLAVCDAVFSIAARYDRVVRPIVARYANFLGVVLFRADSSFELSPRQALVMTTRMSDEEFARSVLRNRQLTSSKSGVLKAQALRQWLEVLAELKVESFSDVPELTTLKARVSQIPGQDRAVLSYFLMLCGNPDLVKPDRHILRFCQRYDGQYSDLKSVALTLGITSRELDYAIWLSESQNAPSRRSAGNSVQPMV